MSDFARNLSAVMKKYYISMNDLASWLGYKEESKAKTTLMRKIGLWRNGHHEPKRKLDAIIMLSEAISRGTKTEQSIIKAELTASSSDTEGLGEK